MSDDDVNFLIAKAEFEKALTQLKRSKPSSKKEPPFCSFCGKGKNEYLHLIGGNKSAKICDQCVMVSYDINQ